MPKTEAQKRAQANYISKDPEAHKARMREAQARYYEKNAEKVRERRRKYYAENIEIERVRRAELYASNPEFYREKSRKWRSANRETFLASAQRSNYKHHYGMSVEERDEKFAEQGFVCAACGADTPGSRRGFGWHIDHNHKTGKVRGILCRRCNSTIGHAEECTERLANLIKYLERYSDSN